jgi:hypothetical protein
VPDVSVPQVLISLSIKRRQPIEDAQRAHLLGKVKRLVADRRAMVEVAIQEMDSGQRRQLKRPAARHP